VRRAEDIIEALWGTRVSPSTNDQDVVQRVDAIRFFAVDMMK
jgi:hypothetical protein